jgi:flagellar biosynthesis protein
VDPLPRIEIVEGRRQPAQVAHPRNTAVALSGGLAKATPRVAAAGQGLVADQILALAEANGVPVERDPALAGLLSRLKVGQVIPPDLYQAIAELLVFLYDLDARVPE